MKTKNVLDMTDAEFEEFQDNLTFEQLEELNDEEFDEIDPDVVREVVENEEFDDIETRIYYKQKHLVPLNEEDEAFICYENKVNGDLGSPLM